MVYLSLLQRIAGILALALWLSVPFSAGNSHAADIGDPDFVLADANDESDSEDSDSADLDDESDSEDSDSADLDDESDSEDSESEDADDSDAEEDSDSNEQSAGA